jgi:hypothetical protein
VVDWTSEYGTANEDCGLQETHVRMDERHSPTETANQPKIAALFSRRFSILFYVVSTTRKPHLD